MRYSTNIEVKDKLAEAQDLLSLCMVAVGAIVEGQNLSKQEASGMWHILQSVDQLLQECDALIPEKMGKVYELALAKDAS